MTASSNAGADLGSRTVTAEALHWRPAAIEGAAPEVHLARLPTITGVGLLVRFPPGWSRPGRGTYEVAEQALFLAGSFEMSGVLLRSGDHAWFPPGYLRAGSSSPAGALVWAWFSGPNRWQEAGAGASSARVLPVRWEEQDEVEVPELDGVRGRLLHLGPERAAYVVDRLMQPGTVGAGLRGVEVFDLATHTAAAVPAGGRLPELPIGPVLVVVVR